MKTILKTLILGLLITLFCSSAYAGEYEDTKKMFVDAGISNMCSKRKVPSSMSEAKQYKLKSSQTKYHKLKVQDKYHKKTNIELFIPNGN